MATIFARNYKHLFSINLKVGSLSSTCIHTTCYHSRPYDIVIVGGGMVGGAMACAIGGSKHFAHKKVLLLDTAKVCSKLLENPGPYGARVCAVSPGNAKFLQQLGVWNLIPRFTQVKRMQVWDSCSDGLITFEENNMCDDLCYIVENDLVVCSFAKVLETNLKDKVEVRRNCQVVSCVGPRNYAIENTKTVPLVRLQLNDGSEITTKLLIAADGANSLLARSCDIKAVTHKYNQSAVVSNLLHEKCDNVVAWQRFLPTGPIALLPLNETTSSLVWSTTHEHAKKLVRMPEEQFISEINHAFWKDYPYNNIVKNMESLTRHFLSLAKSDVVMQYPPSMSHLVGGRFKFPLVCSHGNEYVKPRIAFVGDSVHRIHPLAGQGVNLGFRDVASLIQILDEAVYEGQDLGSLSHLLNFESKQQLSNLPIVTAVHGLKNLFSTDFPPLVALRSIGLQMCNANSGLKKSFIREATK